MLYTCAENLLREKHIDMESSPLKRFAFAALIKGRSIVSDGHSILAISTWDALTEIKTIPVWQDRRPSTNSWDQVAVMDDQLYCLDSQEAGVVHILTIPSETAYWNRCEPRSQARPVARDLGSLISWRYKLYL
ncbi:hypothetical protein MRB53_041205 [Persea americana]|nr:hypothetical protein MRB53_041205 [Persea americana]